MNLRIHEEEVVSTERRSVIQLPVTDDLLTSSRELAKVWWLVAAQNGVVQMHVIVMASQPIWHEELDVVGTGM